MSTLATDAGPLRDRLVAILGGGGPGWLVEQEELAPRVHRLRLATDEGIRSVIVKRLDLLRAARNEMAATRWLPAVGMADACPPLLGTAGDETGRHVWHVYEDLGDSGLDSQRVERERVEAAIDFVADLHVRFADHPLLAEVRMYGDPLGIDFYSTNVRDAINALRALRPPAVPIDDDRSGLRDRVLARLEQLRAEEAVRGRALEELKTPETLLHGDFYATNTLVAHEENGFHVRLIDWEHVGVGPVTYDLSSFLLRSPTEARAWMMQRYRDAVAQHGWTLPDDAVLNALFQTAESARIANRLIWPAIAVLDGHVDWGFQELATIETWFENLRPVLEPIMRNKTASSLEPS